ncbi:MAG: hypothetical protein RIS70_3009 [Planctomycetota bacterium]|jgi:hypothetical protein
MSDAKVRGIVHVIEPTKSYGQKGFRKRLVVIEQNNGRFTNYLPLEFTNDACDRVDEMQLGDDVEIAYRLTGRKWQRDPQSEVKYFLSAEAMQFKVVNGGGGEGGSGSNSEDINRSFAESASDEEDAPF